MTQAIVDPAAAVVAGLAGRMVREYFAHVAAMYVARDPRAGTLAPPIEPGQLVPVLKVPRRSHGTHMIAWFEYALATNSEPQTVEDFDKVWLTGALLSVGDALAKHGYFNHAPEAEMIRHLRNGIAHGNRFKFDKRVIDQQTQKLKYPANIFRYASLQNMPRHTVDTQLQGTEVLWSWGGPEAVIDCLTVVGIEIVPKPARDTGVSGMLIRVGNNFAIAYATHIDNVPFQRFCVGHELGHYFLPGHPEAVLDASGVHESRAGFRSGDRFEVQADRFAAGLLMPRRLFVSALNKAGAGLAAIESLAGLCHTSLHATAIRYTQCTSDPMAIVVSKGDTIDHCFLSDEFKALDGIDWLRKRERVPKNTVTHGFNADASNVQRAARADGSSNLQDWFGGRYNIEVCEDVIGLGSYGKTLTVLYDMELPDDEERENEESLTDSWTPKFRR